MPLSYSDKGKGYPVVLLHGFCETRHIWGSLANDLARKYRVLIPDLPGFGKSQRSQTAFSIKDIAGHVYHWLLSLKIKESVVIGHSLGGYVTLALAGKYPHLVKGLGLFHSTAFADNEEKKASRIKAIKFIRKYGVSVFASSFMPQLFYSERRNELEAEIENVVRMAAGTSTETAVAYTRAMRDREDGLAVLKAMDGPVLIIGGDKDTLISIDDIFEQQVLPKKVMVHILKNTGHMGMIENKTAALQAIENFVAYCTVNKY